MVNPFNPGAATGPICAYGTPTDAGKVPFNPPGTDRACETAYWIWGDLKSSKTPLIALHGGPGGPCRDLKVLGMLYHQHGIPVVLYDQIGCGASTHLRELRGDMTFWTDELFLSELENLLKHFQIDHFDLWGHSCGGMLAAAYALTQPAGLRKLVIASAYLSESLRAQVGRRHRAALPQEMQEIMAACEKEGRTDSPEYQRADAYEARIRCCRLDPWPAELYDAFNLSNEDDTVTHTLYGDDPWVNTGTRKNFDLVPRLHEITETTVPGGILLTNGAYEIGDDLFAPLFTQVRARIKWVRFAESAHFSHLDEHEAYLAALGDFLNME